MTMFPLPLGELLGQYGSYAIYLLVGILFGATLETARSQSIDHLVAKQQALPAFLGRLIEPTDAIGQVRAMCRQQGLLPLAQISAALQDQVACR